MSHCTCPRDGRRLCDRCRALLALATGLDAPLLAPLTPRAVLEAQVPVEAPEGVLQRHLEHLVSQDLHWLWYHTHRSRKSPPGYPDDCFVCPAELLQPGQESVLYLWEAKREGQGPSPMQRRWLEALHRVTRVDARVVQPSDWPWIVARLTQH